MIDDSDQSTTPMQPQKADGLGTRTEIWTFFRQWLRRPLSTAAVSPSSRFLAQRIVTALPEGADRVIELGAGTGTFTRALLDHGIAPGNLLAVEFNPELYRYLRTRFPQITLVRADARSLAQVPEVRQFVASAPPQAIVSGLGLLSMTRQMQHSVLAGAFELLPADGNFIQFTYGPRVPVATEVMRDLGLRASQHSFTLLNLPPARIFIFSRSRSVAVTGQRRHDP